MADRKEFAEIAEDGFGACVGFSFDVSDEGVDGEDYCVDLRQLLQSISEFVVHNVDCAFVLSFALKAAHNDSEDELKAFEEAKSQFFERPLLLSRKLQITDCLQLRYITDALSHFLPLKQSQIVLHDISRNLYV